MTDLSGVALRDLPEALESQQPDGQRLHAATQRDTHSDIFMKGKAMSERERWVYKELQAGDIIQEGDEWWPKDGTGQWQAYHQGMFGLQVLDASIARRPIRATHQTTFEEVPGSRTLQQAVDKPQRPRWAWEELQPGDVIEAGDEWQNDNGHWHPLVVMAGACIEVRDGLRARRPHNITMMLAAFANQAEVLAEVRADEKRLFDDLELLRSEYIKLQTERDEARAEAERLSTVLKSAQRARDELQRQIDELRTGLMGVVSAEHVHSMLEDMLDQTEWVGQCLDSSTHEQMSCIQRTISVIAQRVNDMGKEATSAGA